MEGQSSQLARKALLVVALDRCTGRDEIEPDFELTITREGGALFAQMTEEPRFRVYPSSETTFHHHVDEASLDFEIGEDGRAKRVVIHTSDETASADRIE